MSDRQLDPIVTAATMFSVDRMVAQKGAAIPRPAANDLASLGQYWMAAMAVVGEDLPLKVAADLPIGAFGLASYGLVSAPTLAGALDALSNTWLDRMIPGMTLRVLPVSRDEVDVRMHCDDESGLMALVEEIGLAVIHHHLSLLASPATVLGVNLRRPAPESAAPWKAYFGVTPRFAQRYSTLRLSAASLGIALRTASPELHTIVRDANAAASADDSASGQVRAYVRAHILEDLDAATIAQGLEMTARTLQRKLQVEHTSLREIAASVRIEVARELLEHSDRTIAEISEAVGFAQPASFTRAFVAATNETPADYRKRIQS
ncbi:MAG: AraC family transcriptional regulator ligand-binding domain-containing protein [Kofleriaceae bacterium]|nr:AraC family transcriptional regulator ligand-binding domain-containing protein [Kofleriaceae bacterium]